MTKSLRGLSAQGLLRPSQPTPSEISALLTAAERDLDDARVPAISHDRRFATAYGSAVQLATVVLRAKGYRTRGVGHHDTTFRTLPIIMGPEQGKRSAYLNACRMKRNAIDYDGVGYAAETDVRELLEDVVVFRSAVLGWLAEHHPELRP